MESMEERLLDAMKAMAAKVDGVDDITKRLTQINLKLEQKGERLDRVKTKVDLSMTSLGQVQQEQTQVERALKAVVVAPPPPPPLPPATPHQAPLLSTLDSGSAASTSSAPPQPPLPPPLAPVLIPPQVPSPRYSPGVREHGDTG